MSAVTTGPALLDGPADLLSESGVVVDLMVGAGKLLVFDRSSVFSKAWAVSATSKELSLRLLSPSADVAIDASAAGIVAGSEVIALGNNIAVAASFVTH